MKMCDGRSARRVMLASLLSMFALAAPAVAADAGKSLGMLDQQSWEKAKGLLPDEILDRYKNGEWSHEMYEPPADTKFADGDFLAAGAKNEGRFDIGPDGGIIAKDTGKQPEFIYGPPFPTIDPKDPKAGPKIVWNFFYQSYLLGNSRNFVNLDWVGKGGMERQLGTDVYQRYFDGQPEKYRPQSNSQNFLFQQISGVTRPADVQGTVALTHRFRDPTKRDQVWSYVPALRRVRATSPSNRSDGFLGSDMSQDDGSYFDGKPEDFDWKLVGEGDMLFLYDRKAMLEKRHEIRALPDGGFEARDTLEPRFAYQTDNFSGLAWAPLKSQLLLIKRPVWIVEGTPKDKYYLYGKIVLRFDKQSWRGSFNSKYDWQGTILATYLPINGPYFQVDGEWRSYSYAQFTMAQNWKLSRATVSYADPTKPVSQTRIAYPESFFNMDQLSRQGK